MSFLNLIDGWSDEKPYVIMVAIVNEGIFVLCVILISEKKRVNGKTINYVLKLVLGLEIKIG
jgi:hypothetical protein